VTKIENTFCFVPKYWLKIGLCGCSLFKVLKKNDYPVIIKVIEN